MKRHIIYKWTLLAVGICTLYPDIATAQTSKREILAADTATIERLDGGITS